ncbi:hypothetical protein B0H14DRAFT_2629894 [Mycena olivaceomarginata]|nr:hypothetical protein B0H14DRAFT_2640097 [Mycena olivaceomarginata]KAJ7787005.1 hypothetical protein B0H14DRAFT_2629894 [Mycena olivaceomarginata]
MTSSRPTTASNASTATELESLVALVARLSRRVHGRPRLPAVVAAEVVHARASATAAATAAAAVAATDVAAAEAAAAAMAATAASSVLWARGIPLTPAELEVLYLEGSSETWYVVLCGRQRPTPSATASPIRSRSERPVSEALAWYRQEYHGPTGDGGIQKWTEA